MTSSDKMKPADFVVKAKVKALMKEAGMSCAADVWEELGHSVTRAVKLAIVRAKANRRKTVRGCDI